MLPFPVTADGAFWNFSDPVQDPGIGTHHPGGCHGIDVWLACQRGAHQPAQFPARVAVPRGAEEFRASVGGPDRVLICFYAHHC